MQLTFTRCKLECFRHHTLWLQQLFAANVDHSSFEDRRWGKECEKHASLLHKFVPKSFITLHPRLDYSWSEQLPSLKVHLLTFIPYDANCILSMGQSYKTFHSVSKLVCL